MSTILDGKSKEQLQQNIADLRQLFPEVCCEDKIDFDKLKQILGEYVDDNKERYNFTWNGKGQAIKLSQTPSMGTLRPYPGEEESKNWDTTENLYIEGDNLEVLKLLQKSYYGKVKMIYIDPPYNTGKDFIYPDDYSDSIENYKQITGQVDENGKCYTTNVDTSGRYHTAWLNMMYPRLRVARTLLEEDGVIFISIDDNEYTNLKKIADEIFGEKNLVETFYIQVRYANKSLNEKDDFQKLIENVLVYAKNKILFNPRKPYEEYDITKFCNKIVEQGIGEKIILGGKEVEIFHQGMYSIQKEEDISSLKGLKGTWASGSVLKGNTSGKFFDQYLSERKEVDGINVLYKVYGIGEDGLGYRYFTGPKKDNTTKGIFYSGIPTDKLEDIKRGQAIKEKPIINFYDYSADFGNIRNEGNIDFRAGKKPTKMLKSFMNMINSTEGIFMDFFSGSSSMAHAVMALNAEDFGSRKYIMIQLPEVIDKSQESYRAGYQNICEIGKERIRRAGEKIKQEIEAENAQLKMGEDPKRVPDIGFKVFKLDSSNLKKWQPDYDDFNQSLLDSIDNYVEGRTELDVVYEIMLKMGLELTYPLATCTVKDKNIYVIAYGALMICLDHEITTDVAHEMIRLHEEYQPEIWQVVFKDNGFASDSVKTNIKEMLKVAGLDEDAFTTI
jgi:DNA methylase N-4/N-6